MSSMVIGQGSCIAKPKKRIRKKYFEWETKSHIIKDVTIGWGEELAGYLA